MDHVTQISRDFFFALSQASRHDKHIARCLFIYFFFIKRNVRFCHRGSLMYFVGSINLLVLIKHLTTKSAPTNF